MSPVKRMWPGLDGLRGLAVIAVVAYHAQVLASGYVGVDVFFVLSGFLITRVVIAEKRHSGHIRLGRFYARRALRLYPALVVMVAATVALSVAFTDDVGPILRDGLAALTYTSNFVPQSGILDHTWTLSLEEQFYLVWPLLLGIALARPSLFRLALPIAVLVAILVTDLALGQDGVLHTYVRAMGLPIGCGLALLPERSLVRMKGLAVPAGILLVLVAVSPVPTFLTTGWPVSVAAVLTAPIVARVITSGLHPLESGLLRYFGLRSYSLYLWHFPCISVIVHHGPETLGPVLLMGLAIVASIAVAEMSFRFVERPVLTWRDRTSRLHDPEVARS